MEPERWKRIEELYHAASQLPTHKRASFLDHACAGDDLLRSEVQSLLAQDEKARDFIESPAAEIAAQEIAKYKVRASVAVAWAWSTKRRTLNSTALLL